MKIKVPFTKDILFKSKIAEITSISLEHELSLDNNEVGGVFIVSCDYKTHEVCVNKETFEYKLPFNVEITENIDKDTLNFEIIDFYYDIVGDDTLRVNIEFEVSAEVIKEEEVEEVSEDRESVITPEIADFEQVPPEITEVPLEQIEPPEITPEEKMPDENR